MHDTWERERRADDLRRAGDMLARRMHEDINPPVFMGHYGSVRPVPRILAQIIQTLRELSDRRSIVMLLPLNEWDRDVRYAGRVLTTGDELFGHELEVNRVDARHVRVEFRRVRGGAR